MFVCIRFHSKQNSAVTYDSKEYSVIGCEGHFTLHVEKNYKIIYRGRLLHAVMLNCEKTDWKMDFAEVIKNINKTSEHFRWGYKFNLSPIPHTTCKPLSLTFRTHLKIQNLRCRTTRPWWRSSARGRRAGSAGRSSPWPPSSAGSTCRWSRWAAPPPCSPLRATSIRGGR